MRIFFVLFGIFQRYKTYHTIFFCFVFFQTSEEPKPKAIKKDEEKEEESEVLLKQEETKKEETKKEEQMQKETKKKEKDENGNHRDLARAAADGVIEAEDNA